MGLGAGVYEQLRADRQNVMAFNGAAATQRRDNTRT
jgi:hypothetical protein